VRLQEGKRGEGVEGKGMRKGLVWVSQRGKMTRKTDQGGGVGRKRRCKLIEGASF